MNQMRNTENESNVFDPSEPSIADDVAQEAQEKVEETTGVEGDKRIEAAAQAGHTATSSTIAPLTEVGPENFRG